MDISRTLIKTYHLDLSEDEIKVIYNALMFNEYKSTPSGITQHSLRLAIEDTFSLDA